MKIWIKAIGLVLLEPAIALLALAMVVGTLFGICWMAVYHPILMIGLCVAAAVVWALSAFVINVIATKKQLEHRREML